MGKVVKFAKDVITQKVISTWESGNNILIKGGTGTGKTVWTVESLGVYAKENNKKVLILQNRSTLYNQSLKKVKQNQLMDTITLKTYQFIEDKILSDDPFPIKEYDYIVWDEVHYAFADSSFNDFTDLCFEYLAENSSKAINIFISATAERFIRYTETKDGASLKADIVYTLKNNYNAISNIYQFSDEITKEIIIETIIQKCIANGEKALIYVNNYRKIKELMNRYGGNPNLKIGVAVSTSSPLYNKTIGETLKYIEEHEKFEEDILFSTEVLSTGVTLLDEKLKYILVDSYDEIGIKQAIGRKRVECVEGKFNLEDTIEVFIPLQPQGSLSQSKRRDEERIEVVDYLIKYGGDKFSLRETKGTFKNEKNKSIKYNNSLIYNKRVGRSKKKGVITYNKIEYFNLLENLREYSNRETSSFLNATRLSMLLDVPKENIFYLARSGGNVYPKEMNSLQDFLANYSRKKIFAEDREKISEEIVNEIVLGGGKINSKGLKVATINTILLEEFGIYYQLTDRKRETKGENRDKWYYKLKKMKQSEIEKIKERKEKER